MSSKRAPRYGILASRFNKPITQSLAQGAVSFFKGKGLPLSRLDVRWVPGAFELPVTALRMARSGRYRAVVAVGCILAGETPQYTYLAQAVFHGLSLAGVLSGVPVTCGVVVAKKWRQAVDRSRPKGFNRGREAAEAAWEMAHR